MCAPVLANDFAGTGTEFRPVGFLFEGGTGNAGDRSVDDLSGDGEIVDAEIRMAAQILGECSVITVSRSA